MNALRYVVLRHEGVDRPHFDLMFEESAGSPLKTWRVDAWPIKQEAEAEPLADHRPAYLDYEGEISGGRGWVRRVERGTCRVERDGGDGWILTFDRGGGLELTNRNGIWTAKSHR